jgi:hypothetical protein
VTYIHFLFIQLHWSHLRDDVLLILAVSLIWSLGCTATGGETALGPFRAFLGFENLLRTTPPPVTTTDNTCHTAHDRKLAPNTQNITHQGKVRFYDVADVAGDCGRFADLTGKPHQTAVKTLQREPRNFTARAKQHLHREQNTSQAYKQHRKEHPGVLKRHQAALTASTDGELRQVAPDPADV